MEHRAWKNLLTFLLVLALTVVVVSALSMATAAKTETAPARYSQQVRESQAAPASEMTAAVPEESPSAFASLGAFALILVVSGAGVFLFLRAGRQGKKAERPRRRYSPRADMAFPRV